MKCHKCPVLVVCANAKRTLMEQGTDLDAGTKFCPLAMLVKGIFADAMGRVEEIKNAAKEKEESERESKPSEKKS